MRIMDKKQFEEINAFGMGQPNEAFAQYFIGESFLNPLTNPRETAVFLANVTFEPGCRNNWHIHHAKAAEVSCLSVRLERDGIRKKINHLFLLPPEW